MYSLVTISDKKVTKAKGINKKIKHKAFVDALLGKRVRRHNMKRIQSKLHRIGAYGVIESKRYILADGVNTLAYFYKDIKSDAYG